MKLRIKRLHDSAPVPEYDPRSGSVILTATCEYKWPGYEEADFIELGTGIAVDIPMGYVGLVFPLNSISTTDLTFANVVNIIRPSFKGEIRVRFRLTPWGYELLYTKGEDDKIRGYQQGEPIAQLIVIPSMTLDIDDTTTTDPAIAIAETNKLQDSV